MSKNRNQLPVLLREDPFFKLVADSDNEIGKAISQNISTAFSNYWLVFILFTISLVHTVNFPLNHITKRNINLKQNSIYHIYSYYLH